MATTVKAVPGFHVVATGANIQAVAGQYLVSNITPYPNGNLTVGNTYNISDPVHSKGLVVELRHAPGGGMQTATFEQQT